MQASPVFCFSVCAHMCCIASFPALPCFSHSSASVYYTEWNRRTKNRGGLGTRLYNTYAHPYTPLQRLTSSTSLRNCCSFLESSSFWARSSDSWWRRAYLQRKCTRHYHITCAHIADFVVMWLTNNNCQEKVRHLKHIMYTVKPPLSSLLTNGHLLLLGTIFGHTKLISCSWSAVCPGRSVLHVRVLVTGAWLVYSAYNHMYSVYIVCTQWLHLLPEGCLLFAVMAIHY